MKSLSDEEIEEIAEKAAEKAAEKVLQKVATRIYTDVGKSVIGKLFWMAGALIVGAVLWANSNGWLK